MKQFNVTATFVIEANDTEEAETEAVDMLDSQLLKHYEIVSIKDATD
jgi:hypothetical protein